MSIVPSREPTPGMHRHHTVGNRRSRGVSAESRTSAKTKRIKLAPPSGTLATAVVDDGSPRGPPCPGWERLGGARANTETAFALRSLAKTGVGAIRRSLYISHSAVLAVRRCHAAHLTAGSAAGPCKGLTASQTRTMVVNPHSRSNSLGKGIRRLADPTALYVYMSCTL